MRKAGKPYIVFYRNSLKILKISLGVIFEM